MKNNNIKEMIRQQKMMAEERKEMVSSFILYLLMYCYCLGTARKTFAIKKQTDKQYFRRE